MSRASAEQHTTRSFALGAFRFEVVTTAVADRAVVEALFADLPEAHPSDTEISMFSVLRMPGTDGWSVAGPRLGDRTAATLDFALKLLLGAVNISALDVEPDHLHLHAAAATYDGRAVVIAAERDVGKTTTVAHLVARGWGFVTDETVRLAVGTDEVTGFTKPLSIKPGGREAVAHLEPWMIPTGAAGPDDFRFVAMGTTGASIARGGRPHLVVLLRRPPDGVAVAGATAVGVHPADAVVALMQDTLDAERFGNAVARLAELAAMSRCCELTIGSPAETADAIEALFRLEPVESPAVAVLPTSVAFSPGVVSVAVGDRAVVHDTTSGRVLALDAGATRVWSRLGGWSADDDVDLEGPVIRPFVARLRALGVLAGAA